MNVPYLVADFLLVLLPVSGTATAEEDEGDDEENQKHANYGCCDDASSVGGWTQGKEGKSHFVSKSNKET